MRLASLLVFYLFQLPLGAASPELPCSPGTDTYDSKELLCAIPPAAGQQHFEFIARFSGGHDDTRASIATELDGQPLPCDEGSKKELFGEDGEVSLNCRFSIPAGTKGSSGLKVAIRWSHAQYTDFHFSRRN